MHVGEGVADLLYLRKLRQDRLTHQPQSVLHRRTVVIREGRKGLVVYALPQAVEVGFGRVVPPLRGHDGGEDAVVRIWERRVLVSQEPFPPGVRGLEHIDVTDPGLHLPGAALVARDLSLALAAATNKGMLVRLAVNLDAIPEE